MVLGSRLGWRQLISGLLLLSLVWWCWVRDSPAQCRALRCACEFEGRTIEVSTHLVVLRAPVGMSHQSCLSLAPRVVFYPDRGTIDQRPAECVVIGCGGLELALESRVLGELCILVEATV